MNRLDTNYKTIQVTPNSGALGAWVEGFDGRTFLSRETVKELQQAFIKYKVLFFPDQNLSTPEFLRFARSWGAVIKNPYFSPVDDAGEIIEIRKKPDHQRNIGQSWHLDFAFEAKPSSASLLMAKKLPGRGGDTLFCDLHKAFEALSPGLQKTLKTMKGVNSNRDILHAAKYNNDFRDRLTKNNAEVENTHPVVIHNPETGQDSLFISYTATERFDQWSAEESKPLLDFLFFHVSKPEFCCRFSWAENMVALWSNLYTLHYAVNDYPGEERLMHRITLAGQLVIETKDG